MKKITKENRGGARKGAGAPKKFGEETTTVAFRVPKSKAHLIKKLVQDKLKEWI